MNISRNFQEQITLKLRKVLLVWLNRMEKSLELGFELHWNLYHSTLTVLCGVISFCTEFVFPHRHILPYQCCPLQNSHLGPLYTKLSYHCFKHSVKWIVWNSVSMSHDFACVMVILNIFCWNAILSFGKRRKSQC